MTSDKLKIANEIQDKIIELEKFRDAYVSFYANEIVAITYNGCQIIERRLLLEKYPELYEMILGFITDKIIELNKNFEEV